MKYILQLTIYMNKDGIVKPKDKNQTVRNYVIGIFTEKHDLHGNHIIRKLANNDFIKIEKYKIIISEELCGYDKTFQKSY